MNEKTAQQIARMKEQTIGVEVEMNHISRDKAAKIAADFFGTGRWENTAGRNGYCTWSAWDAQGREWKFQKDVSIAGCDNEKCELVTPILKYEDIESLIYYSVLAVGFDRFQSHKMFIRLKKNLTFWFSVYCM